MLRPRRPSVSPVTVTSLDVAEADAAAGDGVQGGEQGASDDPAEGSGENVGAVPATASQMRPAMVAAAMGRSSRLGIRYTSKSTAASQGPVIANGTSVIQAHPMVWGGVQGGGGGRCEGAGGYHPPAGAGGCLLPLVVEAVAQLVQVAAL